MLPQLEDLNHLLTLGNIMTLILIGLIALLPIVLERYMKSEDEDEDESLNNEITSITRYSEDDSGCQSLLASTPSILESDPILPFSGNKLNTSNSITNIDTILSTEKSTDTATTSLHNPRLERINNTEYK
jgi:hypothetical protein